MLLAGPVCRGLLAQHAVVLATVPFATVPLVVLVQVRVVVVVLLLCVVAVLVALDRMLWFGLRRSVWNCLGVLWRRALGICIWIGCSKKP